MLHRIQPDDIKSEMKDPVDAIALQQAKDIMDELRQTTDGKKYTTNVSCSQLLQVAKRLGDIPSSDTTSIIITKATCQEAFDSLNEIERSALIDIHHRIHVFAQAQRQSISDMTIDIPGGQAGHTVSPCTHAGCYAPVRLFLCLWMLHCPIEPSFSLGLFGLRSSIYLICFCFYVFLVCIVVLCLTRLRNLYVWFV
jgi:histidinol dehydrogenase